ncbi:hypothetical protein [uncultured Hymenobacter sp.]|uniref:hypothetical protein n=1 Tax=uncultured Hymenobacter sp. TaxID=170016 RepID=UPI0035CA19C5
MISLPPFFPLTRLLLAALLLTGTVAQAQTPAASAAPPTSRPERRAERAGQLENAKIAFLTSRLTLSPEQAQRFWPVYNEFTIKRRELNRNGRQLRQPSTATLTDQQVRDNISQSFALRQQELNLEKDYFDRFQKVLSIQQVGQLFQAEHDFTREIIKRVAGPGGRPARR